MASRTGSIWQATVCAEWPATAAPPSDGPWSPCTCSCNPDFKLLPYGVPAGATIFLPDNDAVNGLVATLAPYLGGAVRARGAWLYRRSPWVC